MTTLPFKVLYADARCALGVDESVHLVVTSPPYFTAKKYTERAINSDLSTIDNLDAWFIQMMRVWRDAFRVLAPGRRMFINIMNLPVRTGKTFRLLDLVGRTVNVCERAGFVYKRDIIWQKTNGVLAPFGSYPDPGGILINNMHEFILEFQKPGKPDYSHVTRGQRKKSRLTKEFWLTLKNSDVWLMHPEVSGKARRHITAFPVELPMRLVRGYSFVGETVYDPFCGSGTTGVAALQWGRKFVGADINFAYVKMARERLESTMRGVRTGSRHET